MKRINETNINSAEHWDQTYKDDKYDFRPAVSEYRVVAQYITNGSKVLDLGCGQGNCLNTIAGMKECNLYGIDISPEGIKKAQVEVPEATLMVGDVTNTKLEEQFDHIVCLQTMEHLENPEDLVKEIDRLLKPGGAFFLTVPYLDHVPSSEHIREFDEKDLHSLFNQFKDLWIFPWPSGRGVVDEQGKEVYPQGNWDELFVIGRK